MTVATALMLVAGLRWPALATVAARALLVVAGLATLLAVLPVASRAGRRESEPLHPVPVIAAAGLYTFVVVLAALLIDDVPGVEAVVLALFFTVTVVALFLALPTLCGVLLSHRRPAVRLLAERNAYPERVRSLTASQAWLQKRVRIASQMHDVLGHRLSLPSVHAGALEVRAAGAAPRLSEQAQLVRTTAVAALDDLRTTLEDTHGAPDARTDTSVPDPEGAMVDQLDLETVAEGWRLAATDVAVAWCGAAGEPLDPRVGEAVDQVVREGLTNAVKHAPGAAVTLDVNETHQQITTTVRTTARASSASSTPGTGRGLLGITERAGLRGGRRASRTPATLDPGPQRRRALREAPRGARASPAPQPRGRPRWRPMTWSPARTLVSVGAHNNPDA